MARVPIEEGFFRIPGDPTEPPRLLGSRCLACEEVFFPRRLVCAKCLHEGTEDTELSTRGTIHTWTYCHVPLFGKKDAEVAGYGVAQVDLPEGPRVQSILSGGRDQFAIGTTVEIDLETLRQNSEGDDVVIYRFRPVPGGQRGMKHGLRFDGVAVAGIGMVRFGMFKDTPGVHLARDAGLLALHDAGLTLADVDEAFVGYIQPASMLGIKAMKELGLTGLPVTHIENASATGLVAFREAAWAVSSGRADVAMALCFDKFTDMTGSGGRGAGRDQIDAPILPAAYFALWAQRRMHERGTTPEHFATIAAKNWNYGATCPTAHRQPDHVVTAAEVLAARMVAEPLTTMMCCPPDDGAACIIVAREDLVRARQPGRPLVRALASALTSETYSPGHTFVGPGSVPPP